MRATLLIIVSVLAGCGLFEQKQGHAQLALMRLVPRPGYEGHLTNRICKVRYLLVGKCAEWSIKTFDVRDAGVRQMLNDFGIACKMAGRRFRVSIGKAGFVRRDKQCIKESMFGNCKEWRDASEFIDISRYDYLLAGQMECRKGW